MHLFLLFFWTTALKADSEESVGTKPYSGEQSCDICCKRVHFSDYKCSGDGGEKGSEEEELEKQCDKKLLPNEARHPDSTLVFFTRLEENN